MATILVVDDDADVRSMVRVVLEQLGHAVVEASNGLKALWAAQDARPDLILLDITMPVMDGYTALERIRSDARISTTAVIAITGRAQPADLVRAFELGVLFYLSKPFEVQELTARVKQALEVPSPEAQCK